MPVVYHWTRVCETLVKWKIGSGVSGIIDVVFPRVVLATVVKRSSQELEVISVSTRGSIEFKEVNVHRYLKYHLCKFSEVFDEILVHILE